MFNILPKNPPAIYPKKKQINANMIDVNGPASNILSNFIALEGSFPTGDVDVIPPK